MARLRLWIVMLPLVAAGTEGAASLLDSFAPKRYETAELFSRSNATHGLLPFAAALGAALLLCAMWSFATSAPAGRQLPRWTFACLPPLAFTIQEHAEYVLAHGHVPWTLALSPTFLAGLVLQIPFAIAAYLIARLLVKVAVAIGERGAPEQAPRRSLSIRPRRDIPARARLVGGRRLTRGPPAPLTT